MVEKESQRVPLHGVHVEGDDGDAADCLPKPLLPPLPPSLGEDKFGWILSHEICVESPGTKIINCTGTHWVRGRSNVFDSNRRHIAQTQQTSNSMFRTQGE